MKYPKEYSKKAMELVEREYFTEDEIDATALLTLAAHVVNFLAYDNYEAWGVDMDTAYIMVLQALERPEPYEDKTTLQKQTLRSTTVRRKKPNVGTSKPH